MTSPNKKIKIAILASGRGSNALNIIDYSLKLKGLEVVALVTDQVDAQVIKSAEKYDLSKKCIPINASKSVELLERKKRQEDELVDHLREHDIRWVFLAGYMKILSSEFLDRFYDSHLKISRVINIHPSLLPDYKGLNAYERAFEDGREICGSTIHLVDKGMDTGQILLQGRFERDLNEDLESFKEKGLEVEHKLYRRFMDELNKNEKNILSLMKVGS